VAEVGAYLRHLREERHLTLGSLATAAHRAGQGAEGSVRAADRALAGRVAQLLACVPPGPVAVSR
jgi:hypothetical protein